MPKRARAKERAHKLADGQGLYLFVAKNGSRLWRLDYRFDDRRLTMSLGP
ncbi:MAG: Arm DNA-binding domain-containing protein [Hyphomonadaceae bacterium]